MFDCLRDTTNQPTHGSVSDTPSSDWLMETGIHLKRKGNRRYNREEEASLQSTMLPSGLFTLMINNVLSDCMNKKPGE